ncbi:MAG: biotin/lipoyl-containing protein, partial [Caldimonas sp.]
AAAALLPRRPVPELFTAWSSSPSVDMRVPLRIADATQVWHLTGTRADLRILNGDVEHRIVGLRRSAAEGFDVEATVDGRPAHATGIVEGDQVRWLVEGFELNAVDARLRGARRDAPAAAGLLLAPMHGRVVTTCVDVGASVEAGALLLVIEAMKMEHPVRAPHAGNIAAVHVRSGDQVATRQPLVEVTP